VPSIFITAPKPLSKVLHFLSGLRDPVGGKGSLPISLSLRFIWILFSLFVSPLALSLPIMIYSPSPPVTPQLNRRRENKSVSLGGILLPLPLPPTFSIIQDQISFQRWKWNWTESTPPPSNQPPHHFTPRVIELISVFRTAVTKSEFRMGLLVIVLATWTESCQGLGRPDLEFWRGHHLTITAAIFIRFQFIFNSRLTRKWRFLQVRPARSLNVWRHK